jgi:hypothetical protein
MNFVLTTTQAGRAAILNAAQAGLTISLTQIAVGSGSYTPIGTETALEQQQAIMPIQQSQLSADGSQLDLGAVFGGTADYWVREVGVFAGATLAFLWSDPSANNFLAYKNANVDLLLSFALALQNLPTGIVQVVDSGQPLGLSMVGTDTLLAALVAEVSRLGVRDAARLIASPN